MTRMIQQLLTLSAVAFFLVSPLDLEAADKVLILGGGSRVVQSVYDLGCTRVTSSAATYSAETGAANRTKINAWFATLDGTRAATLVVPYGWIAIDDELTPPSNCAIICGGGWSNPRYHVRYHLNFGAAGFMFVGGEDADCMIHLQGYGNALSVNLCGYTYVNHAVFPETEDFPSRRTPPVARCAAGIKLSKPSGMPVNGRHEIAATVVGCTKAVFISATPEHNHCDNTLWTRLHASDCPTVVHSQNNQAVGHVFSGVYVSLVPGLQNVIFDMEAGGRWTVTGCDISGGAGVSIVKTPALDVANNGGIDIRGLWIDRSVTQSTGNGNGNLILLDVRNASGMYVRINGKISFGGNGDGGQYKVYDPDSYWYNTGDPALSAVQINGSSSGHDIKIDVQGLDTATKEAWD